MSSSGGGANPRISYATNPYISSPLPSPRTPRMPRDDPTKNTHRMFSGLNTPTSTASATATSAMRNDDALPPDVEVVVENPITDGTIVDEYDDANANTIAAWSAASFCGRGAIVASYSIIVFLCLVCFGWSFVFPPSFLGREEGADG